MTSSFTLLKFYAKNTKLYNLVSCGIAAKTLPCSNGVSSVDVTMSDKKKNLLPSFWELKNVSPHREDASYDNFCCFPNGTLLFRWVMTKWEYFEIFQFSTRVNILRYTGIVLMFSRQVKYQNRWKIAKKTPDTSISDSRKELYRRFSVISD